jgi:hypothetical protein
VLVPVSHPIARQSHDRRGARPFVIGVVLLVALLVFGGCGGDSQSAGASSTQPSQRATGGGGRGFAADPKVRACLAKQGITLPTGRPGGGRFGRRGGAPPRTGTNARPPSQPRGGSARFAKLRAALTKCGAQVPAPGAGRGRRPRQTQTVPSAS